MTADRYVEAFVGDDGDRSLIDADLGQYDAPERLEMVPTYRVARADDGTFRWSAHRDLEMLLRWRFHSNEDDGPLGRGYRVGRRLYDGDSVTADDLRLLNAYMDAMLAYYHDPEQIYGPTEQVNAERIEQVERDVAAVRYWLV